MRRILNIASVVILVAGFGGSAWIYQRAVDSSRNVLGYEQEGGSAYPVSPEDSKRFMRDLELYGGKANIFAYELRSWFAGLWHGRSLAVILACLTILASYGCFYAANHLPPSPQLTPAKTASAIKAARSPDENTRGHYDS